MTADPWVLWRLNYLTRLRVERFTSGVFVQAELAFAIVRSLELENLINNFSHTMLRFKWVYWLAYLSLFVCSWGLGCEYKTCTLVILLTMRGNVGPALLGVPRHLTIGPPEKSKLRSLNKGPQPPMVLQPLWTDLKGRAVNFLCFLGPENQRPL